MHADFGLKHALEFLEDDSAGRKAVARIRRFIGWTVTGAAGASVVASGGTAAVLLVPSLLAFRGELSDLADALLAALPDRWSSRADRGSRHERLRSAHVALVWCAWLEEMRAPLELLPVSQGSIEQEDQLQIKLPRVPLPHLGPSPTCIEHGLRVAFEELIGKLNKQLARLKLPPASVNAFEVAVEAVPSAALDRLLGWQLRLAGQAPDYLPWLRLHHRRDLDDRLDSLTMQQTAFLERMARQSEETKTGLAHLAELLTPGPTTTQRDLVRLMRRYVKISEERLLGEGGRDEARHGSLDGLSVPLIDEAFIWTHFRLLRVGDDGRLGRFDGGTVEPDRLDIWLANWLQSIDACEAPLLILGHPGAGKSLITRVLAAALAGSNHTPLRIELRGVADASARPQTQLVEGINAMLGSDLVWTRICEAVGHGDIVAMFDGYDELLQTTGDIHRNYIERISEFQREHQRYGEPSIKAIVTSRVALIHHCTLPPGTLVVKLEPFDAKQRDAWIKIWNRTNAQTFSQPGRFSLSLPQRPEFLGMASQPLLLLLIALYDGGHNRLAEVDDLGEAELYERLIHRFVRRELAKEDRFGRLSESACIAAIATEIERLGIAATGMFHRGRPQIEREELQSDLRFVGLADDDVLGGVSPASKLFNSFYFIHRSRSRGGDRGEIRYFEFLHATFGEYLVAHRIGLQWAEAIEALARTGSDGTGSTGRDERRVLEALWREPEGLNFTLAYTLLNTRPKAVDLLGSSWPALRAARLAGYAPERVDALQERLAHGLLGLVLDNTQQPDWRADNAHRTNCRLPSLLRRLATVSLNIVVVRAACAGGRWTCRLSPKLPAEADSCPRWLALSHLWRAGWPTSELARQRALMVTEFDATVRAVQVHLDKAELDQGIKPGAAVQAMARAIGDDRLFALTTLTEGSVEQIRTGLRVATSACPEWMLELKSELTRHLEYSGSTQDVQDAADFVGEQNWRTHPNRTANQIRVCATLTSQAQASGNLFRIHLVDNPHRPVSSLWLERNRRSWPYLSDCDSGYDAWLAEADLTGAGVELLMLALRHAIDMRAIRAQERLVRLWRDKVVPRLDEQLRALPTQLQLVLLKTFIVRRFGPLRGAAIRSRYYKARYPFEPDTIVSHLVRAYPAGPDPRTVDFLLSSATPDTLAMADFDVLEAMQLLLTDERRGDAPSEVLKIVNAIRGEIETRQERFKEWHDLVKRISRPN